MIFDVPSNPGLGSGVGMTKGSSELQSIVILIHRKKLPKDLRYIPWLPALLNLAIEVTLEENNAYCLPITLLYSKFLLGKTLYPVTTIQVLLVDS